MNTPEIKYYVYVITPKKHRQKSLCGYTDDLKKAIEKHDGKKKGPIKTGGPWEYYIVIEGFKSEQEALACEWLIKHPTREKKRPKEYTGVGGRAKSLNLVLSYDSWNDKTDGLQKSIEEGREYNLYIDPRYKSFDKTKIKSNVVVKNISELKY